MEKSKQYKIWMRPLRYGRGDIGILIYVKYNICNGERKILQCHIERNEVESKYLNRIRFLHTLRLVEMTVFIFVDVKSDFQLHIELTFKCFTINLCCKIYCAMVK